MKPPRPGDKVRIAGLPVTIVDNATAETASMVVCAPVTIPLYFQDNMTGPCAFCRQQVQWRPHCPKKPPKVCLECAALHAHRH